MRKTYNLTGKVFDRLTVISFHSYGKDGHTKWNCICECGNETVSFGVTLKNGRSRSCGCYNRDKMITHGKVYTTEYKAYHLIKSRCYNINNKSYNDYGGRGITMSDEWLSSFNNFISDIGLRPTKNHSVGRIDNNKGYSKENCRWEDAKTQGRNKRNNVILDTKWGKITVAEFSEKVGISSKIIYQRLKRGWSQQKAIELYEYLNK